MRDLPLINSRYWLTLGAASIFGTNTGDMISEYFHLGNLAGLPWIAAALAAVFLAERFSPLASALYFWVAIILIRTGATNIADLTHSFGPVGIAMAPVVLVAFVAMVWFYKRRVDAAPAAPGIPKVDVVYWVCMGLAGVVGTLLGDFGSGGFGFVIYQIAHLTGFATGDFDFSWFTQGNIVAMIVFGGAILWMLKRNSFTALATPVKYWTLLALIRTAGTAAGDYLAHTSLGLAGSSVITGIVFGGLVIGLYAINRENLAPRGVTGSVAR